MDLNLRMKDGLQRFYHRLPLHTIRFRLTLWFTLILAVIMVAFSIFVYSRQSHELNLETLTRLDSEARQLGAFLRFGARDYFEGGRMLLPFNSQNREPLLQENDTLALVDLQGQVVQKIGSISDSDLSNLAKLGISRELYNNPFSYTILEAATSGQVLRTDYLFIVAPISLVGNVLGFLILGSPVDPGGQLHRLLLTLILGNAFTLGVAVAGGYWLAGRAMSPVKTITHTAQQISETDLSQRLNLGTRDELGELARTFDQMLDRLQAAFERQRQFTADASHELRTPLTILNLEASRALSANRTSQEYQRALRLIQSESERMGSLVNNLLTLSRMDAGQTRLQMEPLDLSDLTLEVVELMAPLAAKRGVALSTGDLPELPLQGDRQYLIQMIANLVDNAIKYADAGQPGVRVETGLDAQAGLLQAWLRVSDNGPGIPPEHLPHIFERFYRVDSARASLGDEEGSASGATGSGLGLSIVRWIATAHGGEVSVRSQSGGGTTFEVRLPSQALETDQAPDVDLDAAPAPGSVSPVPNPPAEAL